MKSLLSTSFKALSLSTALIVGTSFAAQAESVAYDIDPSHSQIVFTYEHLGFSTTTGIYSGFGGNIAFDTSAPEKSSVNVTLASDSLYTGWEGRTAHFLSGDFFDAEHHPEITFTSTAIEVTGEATANITGDLTIRGITKTVVLDAHMNASGEHPQSKKTWAGFDATTTVLRSEFDMGKGAPYVSDEVKIEISIEAGAAE